MGYTVYINISRLKKTAWAIQYTYVMYKSSEGDGMGYTVYIRISRLKETAWAIQYTHI